MYYSFFEIFSIGVGPSSSHTVGPMRAAKRYIDNLRRKELFNKVERVEAVLYGSLALTGFGHGTVKAIVYGFMGLEAEALDPEKPYVSAVERDKILHLGQERPIPFDVKKDIIFDKQTFLPEHSNGMRFRAYDSDGNILLEEVYFSVGGGTVVRRDEISRRTEREPYNVSFDYGSAAELLEICEKENLSIADVVMINETALRPHDEVLAGVRKIHRIMQNAIDRGMKAKGTLPGGLNIERRAPEMYHRLEQKFRENDYDPLLMIDWINLWGFAVAEENAAGGQIVTAPTMGSAGIIPAVMRYFERFASHKSCNAVEDGIVKFLLTASGICSLYRSNASISGAEVGCQGEVGVACSMGDPVGGLVQIPCIERNAMGAVKAVNSARIAMKGDGTHFVPLDDVIKTMLDTGRDMNNKYKETSLGGLAVNVPNC